MRATVDGAHRQLARPIAGTHRATQMCAGWLSKSKPVCTHGLQTSLMLIQYLQKMLRMKLKAGMTHAHSSCLP
jgi:hypothetical protein